MIDPDRIQVLHDAPARKGRYVLYWMQASQRADGNHALEYAVQRANELNQPVLAGFGLTDDFPDANLRHYAFMLDGLARTSDDLQRRGVKLVVRLGRPDEVALELAGDASLLICDCGYLRVQREWRETVAVRAACPVHQVESDVIVPVETASDHEEYSAATLRRKIHRHLDRFLQPLPPVPARRDSLHLRVGGEDPADVDALLRKLKIDRSVKPAAEFLGGINHARERLREFLARKLHDYADRRNDPSLDLQSHLSPYLHFGQISPLEIALAVRSARTAPPQAVEAFLEQLIVRRELGVNFCHFNPRYDRYESAVPDWARRSLARCARDRRPAIYSGEQLERAATGDEYWNAAQREMLATGKMHNYMRMYWGKKILEWTQTPEDAFRIALWLNNKYELDGRDPNSFAGVAWCFGKHDRPWTRRKVFGTIRYMNAAGLVRKFDMDAYVQGIGNRNEGIGNRNRE